MVGDATHRANVAAAGTLDASRHVATRDESCVALDLVAKFAHLRLAACSDRVGIVGSSS